jgi:hypothetical protein
MGGKSPSHEWRVCEEYKFRRLLDAPEGDVNSYVLAPKYPFDPADPDKWRYYEPLEDTPDLFLKFARLHRADDQIEAMADWVHSYGTLGHGKPPWTAGAPQDVKGFLEAVGQAAAVLTLYEAVLNGDSERARSAILEDFPFVGIHWRTYNALPKRDAHMDREWVAEQISNSVEEIYGGDYLWHALETAANEVEAMVGAYCSPALSVEEGARDPSGITARWNFKSLLGAMYLQMYWLMAAGKDLTRCEHCGLLISLARPHPEARKRRRDKRFCDDACRQAHHRSKKRSADSPS